ncbi:hypothetical protein BC936DRAFT_147192 [Jimgerdemannia flammicorona]|uniref:Uncharacterized protein n=1 Tax=Jimgerdemannia flammicorona TaxID=994334 RepID=A0A433D5V1_9FUNG|nr:hypothetical protein BC936DRAFT_147192 [Jimgerdemannia flammicorona]
MAAQHPFSARPQCPRSRCHPSPLQPAVGARISLLRLGVWRRGWVEIVDVVRLGHHAFRVRDQRRAREDGVDQLLHVVLTEAWWVVSEISGIYVWVKIGNRKWPLRQHLNHGRDEEVARKLQLGGVALVVAERDQRPPQDGHKVRRDAVANLNRAAGKDDNELRAYSAGGRTWCGKGVSVVRSIRSIYFAFSKQSFIQILTHDRRTQQRGTLFPRHFCDLGRSIRAHGTLLKEHLSLDGVLEQLFVRLQHGRVVAETGEHNVGAMRHVGQAGSYYGAKSAERFGAGCRPVEDHEGGLAGRGQVFLEVGRLI